MRLLLNEESIVSEVLSFARWEMANILKVNEDAITVQLVKNDDSNSLKPSFSIDRDKVIGVTEEDVRDVMSKVFSGVRDLLSSWLISNRQIRGSDERTKTSYSRIKEETTTEEEKKTTCKKEEGEEEGEEASKEETQTREIT